jgi:hypothetical protein
MPFSLTDDQTRGLEKYHSNQQPDLGTLLPTSPASIPDKLLITNSNIRHFVKRAKSYS